MAYTLRTGDELTHVVFENPLDGAQTVPLAEAWQFFEDHDYRCHPEYVIWNGDADRKSFAKGYFVWDFAIKKYRLTRIGVGANGDSGPLNPNPEVHQRRQAHCDQGWVYGINLPASPKAQVLL